MVKTSSVLCVLVVEGMYVVVNVMLSLMSVMSPPPALCSVVAVCGVDDVPEKDRFPTSCTVSVAHAFVNGMETGFLLTCLVVVFGAGENFWQMKHCSGSLIKELIRKFPYPLVNLTGCCCPTGSTFTE